MDILIDPKDIATTAWCFINISNCDNKNCTKCDSKYSQCEINN